MLLDFQIAKNSEGKALDFEIAVPLDNNLIADKGYSFATDCKIVGTMLYEFGSLRLDGEATVEINAFCDKCGEPLVKVLTFPIYELFAKGNSDDNNYYEIGNTSVDVTPMLVDNFFESLPSRIVCKEDCKGLCDMCGKNLNYHSCNCDDIKQELDNQDNPFYKLKYNRGIDKDGSSKD